MNRTCAWVVVVLGLIVCNRALGADESGGQIKLLKTIPMGGEGRWDYLWCDGEARILYVPRSTHVQVLDMESEKVIGDVPGTNGVHGVALAKEQGLGFASSGRANEVTVFELKTFKVVKAIKTGRGPDAILFDPFSKHVFAFNHAGGDVTVIDPAALDKETVTIPVGGTLEFGQSDEKGHVFVNVEDKDEVVEIDAKENKVMAHWPLGGGKAPTGLAIDLEHHRLFVGCGNKKVVVLDCVSGKVLGEVAAGAGIDGAAYDAKLGVGMSANGKDGTITVVKETSPGKFEAVQTLKTIVGAKTITMDSKTHRAVLPCNVESGKFGVVVVGE
jgi:DNA-binding beta-propeller fold protein YncE